MFFDEAPFDYIDSCIYKVQVGIYLSVLYNLQWSLFIKENIDE